MGRWTATGMICARSGLRQTVGEVGRGRADGRRVEETATGLLINRERVG